MNALDSALDRLHVDQMADALATLAIGVEGADRAPTQGMQTVFDSLNFELGGAQERWTRHFAIEIGQLNDRLHRAGLSPLTAPNR
jgi:hypothetical protein